MTEFDLKRFLNENMMDEIFSAREDKIANLSQFDSEKLKKLAQKKGNFQETIENIPETFEKTKKKILLTFSEYNELVNEVHANMNEQYYKKYYHAGCVYCLPRPDHSGTEKYQRYGACYGVDRTYRSARTFVPVQ